MSSICVKINIFSWVETFHGTSLLGTFPLLSLVRKNPLNICSIGFPKNVLLFYVLFSLERSLVPTANSLETIEIRLAACIIQDFHCRPCATMTGWFSNRDSAKSPFCGGVIGGIPAAKSRAL